MLEVVLTVEASGGIAPIVTAAALDVSGQEVHGWRYTALLFCFASNGYQAI
jgi:hypothetical protein